MFARTAALLCALAPCLAAAASLDTSGIILPREPALSPDGSQVVFTYEGDLWRALSTGGAAERLTVHDAFDHAALFSPDGRSLAFSSDRAGSDDVYVLEDPAAPPCRVTFCSNSETLVGYASDGRSVYLLAAADVVHYRGRLLWQLELATGRQVPLMAVTVADAAVSPDGNRVVYTRKQADLLRRGYRGSANADLWLFDRTTNKHTRLTDFPGQDANPAWDPSGSGVYYVSDEDGTFNLWRLDLGSGRKTQLTRFRDDGIRAPAVSAAGNVIVFERGAALYRLEPGGEPRKLEFTVPADSRWPATERLTLTDQATAFAESPDGKQVAMIVRGDAVCMKSSGGRAVNLTDDAVHQLDIAWPKDSKSVYVIEDNQGRKDIFAIAPAEGQPSLARALQWTRTRITDTAEAKHALYPSPDGKSLAYVRGLGDLVIGDLDSGDERVLFTGWSEPDVAWSPDSAWIAYAQSDEEYNSDIWIVPADGSAKPVNVSRDPADDTDPAWSPDGTMLAFASHRGESWDVLAVYLTRAAELAADRKARGDTDEPESRDSSEQAGAAPRTAGSAEQPPAAPPKAETPAAPPKVTIDFEEINQRVRPVAASAAQETAPIFTPDSKRIVYTYSLDGKRDLWSVSARGEGAEPLTKTGLSPGDYRWARDGKSLYVLSGGKLRSVRMDGTVTPKEFTVIANRDVAAERREVFGEAWAAQNDLYYDPHMHGADWSGAFGKYGPVAAAIRDPRDFAMLMNMMLGELNSSHQGFSTPGPTMPSEATGWLGVGYDYAFGGPGLRVGSVLREGPCNQPDTDVAVGDVILQIDGTEVSSLQHSWALLANKVGERVRVLRERAGADGPKTAEVIVRPVPWTAIRDLCYRDLLRTRRASVAALSGGRLGYTHVPGMSMATVQAFARDLYAEAYGKDGLVIDVRDNGGGSTADWLLAMLSLPPHARTFAHGGPEGYPQSRRPFYVWQKPIVVLVNEASFSNAEILAHAIKTIGRGKLVGVATAGGVISTGEMSFLDGSHMRMPGRGWMIGTTDVEMEGHGAEPDVRVEIAPEDEAAGRDPQLGAAVKTLLAQLNAAPSAH